MDADARQITTTDVETSSGSFFCSAAAVASDIAILAAAAVSAMTTASGSSYFSSVAAAGATAAVSAANYISFRAEVWSPPDLICLAQVMKRYVIVLCPPFDLRNLCSSVFS